MAVAHSQATEVSVGEVRMLVHGVAWKEVYEGLGAPELWIFEDGGFAIGRHDGKAYVRETRSALMPDLDFELLAPFVVRTDQPQALKEWRVVIRGR